MSIYFIFMKFYFVWGVFIFGNLGNRRDYIIEYVEGMID